MFLFYSFIFVSRCPKLPIFERICPEKKIFIQIPQANLGGKIFFYSIWKMFSFYLLFYSFFILAEKQIKRFGPNIYSNLFFWAFFNLFLFAPKKRFPEKKIFMKQAVVAMEILLQRVSLLGWYCSITI